jgi:hypothetical protein
MEFTALIKEEYMKHYDTVCIQSHFNTGICKQVGVNVDENKWYENILKPVEAIRTIKSAHSGAKKL